MATKGPAPRSEVDQSKVAGGTASDDDRDSAATRFGFQPRGNPELDRDIPTSSEPLTYDADVTQEQRALMIAEAAYYIAQRRGFELGDPLEDWLIAEAQIDALLRDR
jgi:DUF2934 family protein